MASKDTNVGAPGVTEENVVAERGRDPLPPIGGKKGGRGQSKSRDTIVSLDERTCVLEETMGDVKDRLGYVEQNLQTLEDHVLEELESLKKAVMGQDELRTRFMELFANLQEQLDVVKVGVEETRQETAMCKRAIAGGAVVTHSPRVDAPKPKEFGGKRDAKELDNFIWHMERYFEGASITDEKAKVRTATLYLTDTATLWWRRKHNDIEKGLCTIDTWDVFKKEIKRQFYPENVTYEARKKLRELKHKRRSPLAAQVARSWNEQADVARSYLDKAGRKMKKWADKRRRPKEYNLGDMVMLKLLPQQFKSFRRVHKGLIRKYEGPFPIVAKVGKASYRLELPPKLKIHPVFHYFKAALAARPPRGLGQRHVPLGIRGPLLLVGKRAAGACVASSPDSDLEAFSHNPAHGSFAPLAFQPSAMTNCANQ
ncbi:hypothetical protein RJ639_023240, partial [Escallonia herrerae]